MSYTCTECGGEVRNSLTDWYCRDCGASWGLLTEGAGRRSS